MLSTLLKGAEVSRSVSQIALDVAAACVNKAQHCRSLRFTGIERLETRLKDIPDITPTQAEAINTQRNETPQRVDEQRSPSKHPPRESGSKRP